MKEAEGREVVDRYCHRRDWSSREHTTIPCRQVPEMTKSESHGC